MSAIMGSRIEREFIPYEQALALKELGFDEPCFGTYLSSFQSDWKVYELILEMGINEEFEDNRNVYLLEGACSAPTFSQAFRWCREKHDLHSCVAPVYQDEISKVIVYWFWIQGFDSFEDEDINYKTPEEAELACLNKLIKIVKL